MIWFQCRKERWERVEAGEGRLKGGRGGRRFTENKVLVVTKHVPVAC